MFTDLLQKTTTQEYSYGRDAERKLQGNEHGTSVRGTTDRSQLTWPGAIVATCMSYLTTGGPGKNTELTSYLQLE